MTAYRRKERKGKMLHPFRRYSNSFRRWSRSKSVFCNGALPNGSDQFDSTSNSTPPHLYHNNPCNGMTAGLVKGLSPFLARTEAQVNTRPRRSSVFFSSLVAIPLGSGRLKGGFRESVYAISSGLQSLLLLMRLLGLFPCYLRTPQNRRLLRFSKRVGFLLLTIGAIALNIYALWMNIGHLVKFGRTFGIMHSSSVSTMVSGIKPLINAVNLALFSIRIQAHLRMLRLMDALDRSYWSAFHASPKVRTRMLPILYAFLGLTFSIPLAYRLFDIIKLEKPKSSLFEWLNDYTILVVPLLTIWNVLPLFYYVLCNRLACFWCRTLVHALQKEHHKRRYSLKFYYQQFLRLADLQQSIGDVFNPFVFFSLAWALLILSMTIYFLTQPTSKLYDPITIEQITRENVRRFLNERILMNLGWSLLQILVAIIHIGVICAVGTITNEESRNILTSVLAVIPDSNAELDRFQISCFVHKISTQYLWGMSVWRAFPLERSTFFTLVSVIFTYSFLLLKLKDNTSSPTHTFIVSNASFGAISAASLNGSAKT